MTAQSSATALFLEFSRQKLFAQYWPRLRTCVQSLSGEQLWWRPNPASNSAGNLLLHLNGNVRQWLVASFNREPDLRNRPAEFNSPIQQSPSALLDQLDQTLQDAAAVLARLTEADLIATYEIQGYRTTGLAAVYQVVEHFGMHLGQIIYITKMLHGQDLGFYRELDQSGRSSGETSA